MSKEINYYIKILTPGIPFQKAIEQKPNISTSFSDATYSCCILADRTFACRAFFIIGDIIIDL